MGSTDWDMRRIGRMIDQSNEHELIALMASGQSAMDESLALRLSASDGKTEWVKKLIPVSDPKALNSAALCSAATEGHVECCELLLPLSDPKDIPEAFISASLMGKNNIISLLGPFADPKGAGEGALAAAVDSEDFDTFMAVLDFCAPDAQCCEAMKKALARRQIKMVRVLSSSFDKRGPHWGYFLAAAIQADDTPTIELGMKWMTPNSTEHRNAFVIALEEGSVNAVTSLAQGLDFDLIDILNGQHFKALRFNAYTNRKGDFDACMQSLMQQSNSLDAELAFDISLRNQWVQCIRFLVSSAHKNGLLTHARKIEKSQAYGFQAPCLQALREGLHACDAALEAMEIAKACGGDTESKMSPTRL